MEGVLDPDLQPPVPITLGELRARPESTPGGCEEAGSNRAGRKERGGNGQCAAPQFSQRGQSGRSRFTQAPQQGARNTWLA